MTDMRRFRLMIAVWALILVAPVALADPVLLPSDLSMTITAAPTSNLAPGDSIAFTMTVTNNGPSSLGFFVIDGPQISTQFYSPNGTWNDCLIVTVTGDSTNGPFFIIEWDPTGYVGENPMPVGETRTCHFTLTITPATPPVYAYKIFLPDYWTDLNPANNSATVVLQRAIPTIPALSPAMLLLLAGLLITASWAAHIRRSAA